jgi:SAM-dependent MidA family methyltransferase
MEMSLSEIIKNKIYKQGPISFHDFMEMALYYPNMGYYTSSTDKIGNRVITTRVHTSQMFLEM